MSATNGYQTVAKVRNNKKSSGSETNTGKKKVWIEVKVSPEIDAKAGSQIINKRPAFGIPGKITNSVKLLTQLNPAYGRN